MPYIPRVGTKEIRDQAITNAKIKNGTIDLTKKATYIPVNKKGDTMQGDLSIIKTNPKFTLSDSAGIGKLTLSVNSDGKSIDLEAEDYGLGIAAYAGNLRLWTPNYIIFHRPRLIGLPSDPTLISGLLWFRSDLGRLRFSPDGVTVDEFVKRSGDTMTGDLTLETGIIKASPGGALGLNCDGAITLRSNLDFIEFAPEGAGTIATMKAEGLGLVTGKTVDGIDIDVHDHTGLTKGLKIPYNGLDAIDTPADGEVPTYNAVQNKFEWKPAPAAAAVGFFAPYAGDETEVAETSTTYVVRKTLRVVKDSANLGSPSTLIIEAEAKSEVAGDTTTLGVFVDGIEVVTLSTTNNTYTLLNGSSDISAWADGVHLIELKMKVSAGTGYNRIFEVWLK